MVPVIVEFNDEREADEAAEKAEPDESAAVEPDAA
jgi:hypothetical protein